MPTEMEDYLFDLQGYLILKQAVDTDHLSEMNSVIDRWATKEDAQAIGVSSAHARDDAVGCPRL